MTKKKTTAPVPVLLGPPCTGPCKKTIEPGHAVEFTEGVGVRHVDCDRPFGLSEPAGEVGLQPETGPRPER